jgi:Zn-finger nucleic acid-binding protein
MMKCPRCTVEMRSAIVGNVELDTCDRCEGIWFDRDELQTVLDHGEYELGGSEISRSLDSDVEREEAPGSSDMSCPRCNAELTRYNYSYESGIILDTCPDGCGLWMDDGELKKILHYIDDMQAPVDSVAEAELILKIKKIRSDANAREEELIDGMVSLDNTATNVVTKAAGNLLQSVYRLLFKAGI